MNSRQYVRIVQSHRKARKIQMYLIFVVLAFANCLIPAPLQSHVIESPLDGNF